MPERKLRFQTVQSEFQMRCNSMENIKCQSPFCTVRREGFSTVGWLAQAHCRAKAALRHLSHLMLSILTSAFTRKKLKIKKKQLKS